MIDKKLRKNIFISSIILFFIGVLFHFTYDFSNDNFIVGLITPVNESIFEHLKLAVFPILLWWIIFYWLKKDSYSLNKSKWFLGCLVSIIISIIVIPSIYYFAKYGLDKESIIIDTAALYISLLLGQFIGYHIYNYAPESKSLCPIIMICIIVISFIILTIYPPKLPLFEDNQTHTYGINKEVK